LSEDHTTWTFIDEIAAATRDPGHAIRPITPIALHDHPITRFPDRPLVLQRRSAVAFDGTSAIGAPAFLAMLSRVMPQASAPWDALWWDARIHLAIFAHRVDGLPPGLYLLARDPSALDRLRAACGREALWQRADAAPPLHRSRAATAAIARRLSCDQDIAADGLSAPGRSPSSTRARSTGRRSTGTCSGVGRAGQVRTRRSRRRATGIGCFYDDPVHDALGSRTTASRAYHFAARHAGRGRAADNRASTMGGQIQTSDSRFQI
jgi:hypothetical protein